MAGVSDGRKRMNWNYREIRIADLLEEDLYCLRYRVEGKELSERLGLYGFLNPILVLDRKDKFQVLSGFRRLYALRALGREKVPVAVLSGSGDDLKALFRVALLLNEPSSYGELDRTVIVSKALHHFG